MKLTTEQQKSLHRDAVPQMLEAALRLARDGWNVFPLVPGTKVPRKSSQGCKEGTTDEDQIRRWWNQNPTAGIGANLGDDRICFDIDLQHGGEFLNAFPETRKHLSGRGNGNAHLIYRYEPGSLASMVKPKNAALGRGIDIKVGRGAYIVMPPTLHEETGKPYTAASYDEHLLSDEELQAIYDEGGAPLPAKSRAARKGISVVTGGRGRASMPTMLSELLQNPPSEGSRNEWLSKVAGHYAKQYRDKEDLFRLHVEEANQKLPDPLEDAEFEKTVNSIWGTETREHPEREASDKTGWLVGNGRVMFCQIMRREGEENVPDLAPWGDFDIRAEGVAIDDAMKRVYWVKLLWSGHEIRTTVDSSVLGDDRKLRTWLAAYGASFDTPFNAVPKTAPGVRIMRYLASQEPPEVAIVDTLGWQTTKRGDGFVTHDGFITEDGWEAKERAGVVANPKLVERDLAPYHYGWHGGSRVEAVKVLKEVMTFQEPETVAMFGAWWAACLLKPQISAVTSLFPIFGVEATSESGKTTGYFDLMVQLNGNHQGHVAPTKPVLRDYASANRNGIVWVDDLDSLSAYEELLRASTTNGTVAKMDADNTGVKSTLIVSPMFISGENLGFNSQKALSDRAVVIGVNSPKNRKGPDGKPQWEQITRLKAKYDKRPGGITDLAGWFVVDALKWSEQVVAQAQQEKGSGRNGNKHGVMIAGATLLDSILAGKWVEDGDNRAIVKAWCKAQESVALDQDNSLTMNILPWALRTWGRPSEIAPTEMQRFVGIETPAIIRKSSGMRTVDEVWYSPTLLADAWARDRNGRVSDRTESQQALIQQAAALGGERKAHKVVGTKRAIKMRLLPPEYTEALLQRLDG